LYDRATELIIPDIRELLDELGKPATDEVLAQFLEYAEKEYGVDCYGIGPNASLMTVHLRLSKRQA
jgi:hypothetical protein